jgi:hypothetical protein
MNLPGLPRARWPLALLAAAWPFGWYQTLPGLPIRLSDIAIAAMLIIAAHDLWKQRRLYIPFELFWPALAIVMAAGAAAQSRYMALEGGAAALVLLLTLHLTRSRETALFLLSVSGISAAAAALFSLLPLAPRAARILPLESGAGGAAGPPEALFILIICLPAALCAAGSARRFFRYTGRIAALSTGGILLCFVVSALPRPGPEMAGMISKPLTPASAAAALLSLWLALRVMAKLIVRRVEKDKLPFWRLLFLCGGCAAALLFRAVPLTPGYAFMLASAAIAASPLHNRPAPFSSLPLLLAMLPVLLTGAFHSFAVPPSAPGDPRDFRDDAARLLKEGRFETLDRLLGRFENGGGDPWAALFRARRRLKTGDAGAAAAAFEAVHAAAQGKKYIGPPLPPPGEAESQRFLDELRDFTSAQPPEERSLAYERALIAAGQTGNAMAMLRLRAGGKTGQGEAAPEAAARELAARLHAPGLAAVIQHELTAAQAAALLQQRAP